MQEKEGELCSFFRNFGNAEPSEKPEEISYASTGLIDLRLFFQVQKTAIICVNSQKRVSGRKTIVKYRFRICTINFLQVHFSRD